MQLASDLSLMAVSPLPALPTPSVFSKRVVIREDRSGHLTATTKFGSWAGRKKGFAAMAD
jgi:hypothetical protein